MSTDMSGFLQDPIDIVALIARSNKWEFNRKEHNFITTYIKRELNSLYFHLVWDDAKKLLTIFCANGMIVSDTAKHRMQRLFSILNIKIAPAQFYIYESNRLNVFFKGIYFLKEDCFIQNDTRPTTDKISRIISDIIILFDHSYPAMEMVHLNKMSPENAIRSAMIDVAGHG